ncbi:uncharacterized protein V6R79_001928 [Siganus canaliculatus]
MAASHIRGIHSRHQLHLCNYSPRFHGAGRDNERLALTVQGQTPLSRVQQEKWLSTGDDKLLRCSRCEGPDECHHGLLKPPHTSLHVYVQ